VASLGKTKGTNLISLPALEQKFDKLSAAGYEKTSDATGYPPNPGSYNSIAWAASDIRHFLWPDSFSEWPFWSQRVVDRDAFIVGISGARILPV